MQTTWDFLNLLITAFPIFAITIAIILWAFMGWKFFK